MRTVIVRSSGQYWVCSQAGTQALWVPYSYSERSRKEDVPHKDVTVFGLPAFPGTVEEIILVHT